MSKIRVTTHDEKKFVLHCPGCKTGHWFNDTTWTFNHDMEKPTIHPSLLVRYGNEKGDQVCHSFVTDGKIKFLDDCTHELKGQTVELIEF